MHLAQAVVPIVLFIGLAVGLTAALFIIAALTNRAHANRVTRMPYESGMDPIHDTRRRFDVRFHLVAIAFLVFDVEVLFLFPWAVAARPAPEPTAAASGENARPAATIPEAPSGTATAAQPTNRPPLGIDAAVQGGLVESRHLVFGGVMVFVLLLAVGFVYDVRKGVFQWR